MKPRSTLLSERPSSALRARRRVAFFLASAVTAACSAPPSQAPEHTEQERAADTAGVDVNAVLSPTNYTFTISSVDVLLANDNRYGGGFVEWAGLDVNVTHEDTTLLPTSHLVGCTLGHASKGDVLGKCADPGTDLQEQGKLLSIPVQINSLNDTVTSAIALDDTENSNAGAINDAAGKAGTELSVLGNGAQGAGTIVGAFSNVAPAAGPVGAIIGVVGIGLSIAATYLGVEKQDSVDCTGGLIKQSNPAATFVPFHGWIPNKNLDTLHLPVFSGRQLREMTASGPATISFPVNITWPISLGDEDPGTCNSSHTINVTIARDWTTGGAAYARSGDTAVTLDSSEIDDYFVKGTSDVMRRYYDPTNGWQTQPIYRSPSWLSPTTPIASVVATPGVRPLVWVDGNGALMTSRSNTDATYWATSTIIPATAKIVPASAPVAAVARKPSNMDVFFIGKDGGLWSSWHVDGETVPYPYGRIGSSGVATPGTGVAAIAPTPNNLEVFFIGQGGVVWRAAWDDENGWSGPAVLPKQTPNAAPAVAAIAAAARSTSERDVFFVGNDGAVHWTTLVGGGWVTDKTDDEVVHLTSLSGTWEEGAITAANSYRPGASLSANVRMATDASNDSWPAVDLAVPRSTDALDVLTGPLAVAWPQATLPSWPQISVSGSSGAHPNGRVSLVSPTNSTLHAYYQDPVGVPYVSWADVGGAWQSASLGPMSIPGESSLAAIWQNGSNTSVAIYAPDGHGGFSGWTQGISIPGWNPSEHWVQGDFNGDGRQDIVGISEQSSGLNFISQYTSVGANWAFTPHFWDGGGPTSNYGGWMPSTKWLGGDFDGDGISDLAGVWANGSSTSIAVCNAMSTGSQWTTFGTAYDSTQPWLAADVDGDGLTDIVNVAPAGIYNQITVHRSTGAGFAPGTAWLAGAAAGGWEPSTVWLAGDFNGDGKADLAAVWNNAGSTSVAVFASLGSSFAGPVQWNTWPGWDPSAQYAAGDFNGDGRADIVDSWAASGHGALAMRLSTGSSFVVSTALANAGGWAASTTWLGGKY